MKVAVIIPVYNRAELLLRAVNSVLAQTRPPDEVIVVDDGSTDDPGAALNAPRYKNVRLIHQSHLGVSAARNRAIESAESDWLAFLDSDDYWLPSKLERQLDWHERSPESPVSQTDELWVRGGRQLNKRRHHEKSGGDIFEQSLERCMISPSAALLSRSLFDKAGPFDETLPACEDYDLWLRVTARYPVGLIAEPLVVKTGGHDDQLSRKHWGMDRFRVRSLANLLDGGTLSPSQTAAATDVLKRKLAILRTGALKRDKSDDVAVYDRLLSEYLEPRPGAGAVDES